MHRQCRGASVIHVARYLSSIKLMCVVSDFYFALCCATLRGNNTFYYYAEAAVQHDVIENTIFGYRWFTSFPEKKFTLIDVVCHW